MKIAIYTDDGKRGYVLYNEDEQSILITHPSLNIRSIMRQYFNGVKEFIVPNGPNIGDRAIIEKKPIENSGLFTMALCEMYYNIKVHVDWKDPDNVEDNNGKFPMKIPESTNLDTKSNTIVKSVEGNTDYEIIN